MRVATLLDALAKKKVTTRAALRKELKQNPRYLQLELRACFRSGHEQYFDNAWRSVC